MAETKNYADWLTVNPTSGSGNASVSFSAAEHTGRTARSATTVTFSATGVSPKTVSVTQAGKLEFVGAGSQQSAPKGGGSITISGTSNATGLTILIPEAQNHIPGLTAPAKYTAASVETTNGQTITGDPGASAQYSFSFTLSVPENTTTSQRTAQIVIESIAQASTQVIELTQAAGDPTLSVSPTTITLSYGGGAQTVTVTSNTNWTVS